MNRAILGKFLAILGILVATGCATSGKDFPSDIDWLKQNSTSQKDVTMVLGSPFAVGNSTGTPTWTYGYYKYQLFGNSFTKELKLYWDQEQKLSHYTFSSSFPHDVAKTDTSYLDESGSNSK